MQENTGNAAADVHVCPANAKRWRSSFGQGSHRDDEKMCTLIAPTSSAHHEQLNNSVLFILCQDCLPALYRQEQCGLFCSWLPAEIQQAEGKVLELQLLPLVLEKAWLSLSRSCFVWKLVHRCTNLRIIVIKKLRPRPAGSSANRISVGQRGTLMGYCRPESDVLPSQCPLPHLSPMVNWLWSPLETIKLSSHLLQ